MLILTPILRTSSGRVDPYTEAHGPPAPGIGLLGPRFVVAAGTFGADPQEDILLAAPEAHRQYDVPRTLVGHHAKVFVARDSNDGVAIVDLENETAVDRKGRFG